MSNDPCSFMAELSEDHRRLDALLDDAAAAVDRGDLGAAMPPFSAFHDGLERHIRFEEEVVFPIFEERTGMRQGPTTVMRAEHRAIRAALADLAAALQRGEPARFEAAREALLDALGPHNEKEEQVLYPMTDEVVGENERRALVARLPTS